MRGSSAPFGPTSTLHVAERRKKSYGGAHVTRVVLRQSIIELQCSWVGSRWIPAERDGQMAGRPMNLRGACRAGSSWPRDNGKGGEEHDGRRTRLVDRWAYLVRYVWAGLDTAQAEDQGPHLVCVVGLELVHGP